MKNKNGNTTCGCKSVTSPIKILITYKEIGTLPNSKGSW